MLCTTKNLIFNRNIFSQATAQEIQTGSVRLVNLLDPQQTQLPHLTIEELNGIQLGPYQVNLSEGYMTDIAEKTASRMDYQGLDNYYQNSSQIPADIPALIFAQNIPPVNYNPNRFGPWEPCNILAVHNIPSKNKNTSKYTIALMYVPINIPVQYNWMGYRQPNVQRIKAICCGKSLNSSCPAGSATACPCAHRAAVLKWGTNLAFLPHLYRSNHRSLNFLHPGNNMGPQHVNDVRA